ncbi:MAG: ubiquinol-cytochrome c reductase iron-sulfur subunit [Nitrospinae bacterium]|nr:ubiquinol-cytochrome c reductase iron-sulfur subunit [Nitrospinota bacterium]
MNETASNTAGTDRRTFLQWLISGLLLGAFAAAANVAVRFLMPPPKAKKATELSIPTAQIPLGSSLVVEHKGEPVIIVHSDVGFVAFSPICTHLGCLVKWVRDENILLCPCHAGKFDLTGKVIAGPPPEPLHPVKFEIQNETIVLV